MEKEKRPKKSSKYMIPPGNLGELSQNAWQPSTFPTIPGNVPPPPPSLLLQQQGLHKVAIPRGQPITVSDHNKVAQACEPCRKRKTRCSGELPQCKHCEEYDLQCVYHQGKRGREKKEFSGMVEKLDKCEKLLREISPQVDETMKQRVQKVLGREIVPMSEGPSESPLSSRSTVLPAIPFSRIIKRQTGSYGEDRVTARVGSTDSLDKVDEDFNRDADIAARRTGYYGKNSEITWMQQLQQQTNTLENENQDENEEEDEDTRHSSSYQETRITSGVTPLSLSASTYHCDDLPFSIDAPQVDPYESPPESVAERLFHFYLDTVHPTFPIIGKITFIKQYNDRFANHLVANDNWLAILNFIFAIGAKYAHLIQAEWRGEETDHVIYFTRALRLGFNAESILGHAELQRVQMSGLMAFYLMATNQINRSWIASGIAIRLASTLGLNLRNDSPDVSSFSKEIRYRLWWALCFLEWQLAVMTGRPTSLSEADCSCPLPSPVDESGIVENQMRGRFSGHASRQNEYLIANPSSTHSYSMTSSSAGSQSPFLQHPVRPETFHPNIGLYFFHHTKLSKFTNQVLCQLYRVANMDRSWAETQSIMAKLDEELDRWRQDLPVAFDFTKQIGDQQWICQRRSLGFCYYSAMLIVNRPCLCRMDRNIAGESGTAEELDKAAAAKCVHAAFDMLNLLPDEPDPVGMYKQCPWWCLVHHLVQAAVVCMLELLFSADHMLHELDEVFENAEKAVRWLENMSGGDVAASRAFKLCSEMLRKVSPNKLGKSVSDDVLSYQPMQGLQSFNSQTNPMTPGAGPHQSSTLFHLTTFSTHDQMMSQDPLPYNLLPGCAIDQYTNMFPSASEMEAMGLGDSLAEGHFPDEDSEQHQWYPE